MNVKIFLPNHDNLFFLVHFFLRKKKYFFVLFIHENSTCSAGEERRRWNYGFDNNSVFGETPGRDEKWWRGKKAEKRENEKGDFFLECKRKNKFHKGIFYTLTYHTPHCNWLHSWNIAVHTYEFRIVRQGEPLHMYVFLRFRHFEKKKSRERKHIISVWFLVWFTIYPSVAISSHKFWRVPGTSERDMESVFLRVMGP